jgi:CheY-like chemotaxis protein
MRILVAEDDAINQKLIVSLLKKMGFLDVTVASNGKQAAETYATRDFDIVLMDIQMPELDGFEATRLIREDEQRRGKRVPIVACTAHAMVGYRERCLEAGMDGYVTKPISRQQLLETIMSFATSDLN